MELDGSVTNEANDESDANDKNDTTAKSSQNQQSLVQRVAQLQQELAKRDRMLQSLSAAAVSVLQAEARDKRVLQTSLHLLQQGMGAMAYAMWHRTAVQWVCLPFTQQQDMTLETHRHLLPFFDPAPVSTKYYAKYDFPDFLKHDIIIIPLGHDAGDPQVVIFYFNQVLPADLPAILDYAAMVQTLLDACTRRQAIEQHLRDARHEAEASVNVKDQFLATMSHEIRTPMNGIIGMTTLLQDTGLDDRQQELVQLLRTSSNGLLTLLNDILDFSKLEAEKIELEAVTFNPRLLCDDVLALFASQAMAAEIDLAVYADANVPELLFADEGRLRQILTNLVSNAIKFTVEGSITITLELVPATAPHQPTRLSVCVKDTGCGMTPEVFDKIFSPFEQVMGGSPRSSQSLPFRHGGTGLGLTISRQLCQLMGGNLRLAASVVDQGSTFYRPDSGRSGSWRRDETSIH